MKKTLLIMAAGMGSRFGGLKQIEPMGPNGEILIEYSIYDAIKAGFNKVVFIIKEENYDIFKTIIGNKIAKQIEVDYAFQSLQNLPQKCKEINRTKPWGTSHAIMCAKEKINEPFAIINADDFYGKDAFIKMSEFLSNSKDDYEYSVVGYKAVNTLSENGSVKRGIIKETNGYLTDLIESKLEKVDGKLEAISLEENEKFFIDNDTYVSMNMLGFKPTMFKFLEDNFAKFIEKNKNNLESCEYLIPESLYNMIKKGYAKARLIPTSALWYGVTYKEDKENVTQAIKKMIDDGDYPRKLW